MITIGIPTYNEERTIARCIESALEQIGKKDEVIVVASGCTDHTVPEIKRMKKRDKRVKLITEPERRGKASALNLIIENAKGDIIVQTDGDVVIENGAIKELVNHFKNPKIGGVSGNPIPIIPKDNVFHDWTIMSYRKIGEVREKETKEGKFWHLSGYLLAFRKKALKKVPFAKGAVDALMGKIIKDNDYRLIYEPKAKVRVKCPTNTTDFINQKARVRAGYYLLQKGPRSAKKEVLWLPRELARVPVNRWPSFLYSGFVYLYSWIKGGYMAKTKKPLKHIWKTPISTK